MQARFATSCPDSSVNGVTGSPVDELWRPDPQNHVPRGPAGLLGKDVLCPNYTESGKVFAVRCLVGSG